MNYDIFISYSSKNSTTALAICHELEDNGIKCWVAPRDIPVGAKYASVITQAIKECKAVVLVFSEQSALSPWVESEINIAFSNRKPIVPYKIDSANLEDYEEFYLMLNNRHWIEAYPDYKTRFKELVSVVSKMVGILPGHKSDFVSQQTNSENTYKVGDYYDDGKKQGVVFEVSADGKHGKIVSLVETRRIQWSYEETERVCKLKANDMNNGANNMAKVMQVADWRVNYPAFAWCVDLGEGWYLPAIEELKTFLMNKDVYSAINITLKAKGEALIERGLFRNILGSYWSSTSNEEGEIFTIGHYNNDVIISPICYLLGKFRAVAKF